MQAGILTSFILPPKNGTFQQYLTSIDLDQIPGTS
jgi:hypothetical protein